MPVYSVLALLPLGPRSRLTSSPRVRDIFCYLWSGQLHHVPSSPMNNTDSSSKGIYAFAMHGNSVAENTCANVCSPQNPFFHP